MVSNKALIQTSVHEWIPFLHLLGQLVVKLHFYAQKLLPLAVIVQVGLNVDKGCHGSCDTLSQLLYLQELRCSVQLVDLPIRLLAEYFCQLLVTEDISQVVGLDLGHFRELALDGSAYVKNVVPYVLRDSIYLNLYHEHPTTQLALIFSMAAAYVKYSIRFLSYGSIQQSTPCTFTFKLIGS